MTRADELHAEAQTLLHENLLVIIRRTGTTYIGGSFGLDLVAWRDIDMNVRLVDNLDILTFFELGAAITR